MADAAMLLTAAGIAGATGDAALGWPWQAALVLVVLAALGAAGGYRLGMRLALAGELKRVVSATSFAVLTVTAVAVLLFRRSGFGDAAIAQWVVASVLVSTGRVAVQAAERAARARGQDMRRTLIVGAGEVGHVTARRLLEAPQYGLRPIGFLDKEPLFAEREGHGAPVPLLPVLGASWDLDRVMLEEGVEQVIVAFSTAPHSVLLQIVRTCWNHDVPVRVVPRLYEVEGRRAELEHVGALPLIGLRPSDPRGWQFRVKYALDRVIAAIALVALSPVLVAVALAVLVKMGRPVLFRQLRVGRDGRSFEILKFRTMTGAPDVDGEADASWASLAAGVMDIAPATRREDRRTRLGALLRDFSLDELPQLWNVMRGDMSIVGPRPERPHYVERFRHAIYRYPERHRVKSGLTGWAQIHGLRGETSLHDRVEWDNFYIENWSPWLDLRILAMTLPEILTRRGR
jgi:exopolysaccharide biosynthesis polyprenyl glycosylphosphotransferase